jgi:hypothetical protein
LKYSKTCSLTYGIVRCWINFIPKDNSISHSKLSLQS